MAKLTLKQGTTSKLLRFFAEKADGTGPFTGLLYNTAGLTCYYIREGDAASTLVTAVTGGTVGTYGAGTLNPVDATNMPGVYELGLPNAALSSGKSTWIMIQGAVNLAPIEIEIELTAVDNQDAVRGGLTALPNAGAAAAGGLLTFGVGAGQMNPDGAGNVLVSMAQIYPTTPISGTHGEALAFADQNKRILNPYSPSIIDGSSTTLILDTNLNTLVGNKDITGDQILFTTGANSAEEARYITGYYFAGGNTYGNVAGLTTAGQVNVDVAFPAAPANGDLAVLLTDGTGKKLYQLLTTAMGSDNKILLSATQAYVNSSQQTVQPSWYVIPPTVVAVRTEMDTNSVKLANLDAAVSSRSVYAGGAVASVTGSIGGDVSGKVLGNGASAFIANGVQTAGGGSAPTVIQIRQEMDTNSTKLALLDAAVSSRSTFAGGAVASVTGAVGSVSANVTLAAVPPTAAQIQAQMDSASTQLAAIVAGVAGVPAALLGTVTSGGLTLRQLQALQLSLSKDGDRVWTALTHTAVVTYYHINVDQSVNRALPTLLRTTVYDVTNAQIVSQTDAITVANL